MTRLFLIALVLAGCSAPPLVLPPPSSVTLAALTATNNEASAAGGYPITAINMYSSAAGGSAWTEGRAVQTVRKVFSTFTTAQPVGVVAIAKPAGVETCTMLIKSVTAA